MVADGLPVASRGRDIGIARKRNHLRVQARVGYSRHHRRRPKSVREQPRCCAWSRCRCPHSFAPARARESLGIRLPEPRSARQSHPSPLVSDQPDCFNIGDIESRLPLLRHPRRPTTTLSEPKCCASLTSARCFSGSSDSLVRRSANVQPVLLVLRSSGSRVPWA